MYIPSHLLKTYHESRIKADTGRESDSYIGAKLASLLGSVKMLKVSHKQDTPKSETTIPTVQIEQL